MQCYFCRAQIAKGSKSCPHCQNNLDLAGMELVAAMGLLSAEAYSVERLSGDSKHRIISTNAPGIGRLKFAHQTLKYPGSRDPYRVHCDGQFSLELLGDQCVDAKALL